MVIDAGGTMPKHQDVPPEAFITRENVWRLQFFEEAFGVFVLSYPWLDWWHPDRTGAQLRGLLPMLKGVLKDAKSRSPYCTAAIMIDFLCLPQKPHASAEETERFKRSLRQINKWYFHPFSNVLIVSTPPPAGAEYTNVRLHAQRGWCFFEKYASCAVKFANSLLDISSGSRTRQFNKINDLENEFALNNSRLPPLSPPVFASEMRTRVADGSLKFTSNADMEFVIRQFRTGFVEAFEAKAAAQVAVQYPRLASRRH